MKPELGYFPESLRKKRGPQLSKGTLDRWRRSNWARVQSLPKKRAWDLIHRPLIPTGQQLEHLFLPSPQALDSETSKSTEEDSGILLRSTMIL